MSCRPASYRQQMTAFIGLFAMNFLAILIFVSGITIDGSAGMRTPAEPQASTIAMIESQPHPTSSGGDSAERAGQVAVNLAMESNCFYPDGKDAA